MKWISVDDDLPECWCQHGADYESSPVITYDEGEYDVLSYWKLSNGRTMWSDKSNPTHWMPLPEPPIK